MSVKVMAQRINLPNVGERFCLRTARADSVSPKELLEYVSKRLGKHSCEEVLSVVSAYMDGITDFLVSGRNVNSSVGHFAVNARGVLETMNEPFAPKVNPAHCFGVAYRPTKRMMTEIAARTVVERVVWHDHIAPHPESSMALIAETALLASAGDVVLIMGERLMFDKKDALQGVFFKNGKSIRITKYLSVGDNKLEIQLPFDMKAGTYSILISSNLTGMKLRTGEMEEKFVVA